jgi:peptidoglycan/LPS O-acetylase OafA/YrhL
MRADIQALRAIAVLAVVAYHLWPTRLAGGFMGVDVFFVISGYLMTMTIWKGVREVNRPGGHRLRDSVGYLLGFYARRIKRLAPAATVCLLAILAVVRIIGNFGLQMATAPQVFASTIFMQNWFLASQAADYLGAGAGATAVQHFWSLSIEEQFYMLWPLLLLLAGLFVFTRPTDGKPERGGQESQVEDSAKGRDAVIPLAVILLFTAASFAYGLYLTYNNPAAAYLVTPARIWELSLGGIIVFLPALKHRGLRLALPWLGVALITYALLNSTSVPFPGWYALIPTLGALLVIHGGGGASGPQAAGEGKAHPLSFASLSRFRPAQFFGDISYSLYLYHWPLLVLAPFVLPLPDHSARLIEVIFFVLSVVLAWLSYRLVESPTRAFQPKKAANAKVWAVGAACLATVLVLAYAIQAWPTNSTETAAERAFERAVDPGYLVFGARATQHWSRSPSSPNPYGLTDPEWAQFGSSYFSGVADDPANGFEFTTRAAARGSLEIIGEFGDSDAEEYILVLGDSHSQQWYPALDIAARNLGFKVIAANSVQAGGGMFELDYSFGETWVQNNGVEFSVSRANGRFNWIKDNLWDDASLVVVGVSPRYFTGTGESPETSSDASARLAATLEGLYAVTGTKPVLIQAPPRIEDYDGQTAYIDKMDKVSTGVEEYMNRVYNGLEGIGASDTFEYLEVSSLFLDDGGFSHTQIGGVPVYHDEGHINTLYAASAGEFFTERLRAIIGE